MNKEYSNYYKNRWLDDEDLSNYDKFLSYFEKNFNYIFKDLNKDINILELWSWQGKFAYYCKKKWFKNYIWFDLDENIINHTQKILPDYTFTNEDVLKHLKNNKNKYDIIFISHVFEHFTLEEWKKLSWLIHWSLKKWWKWINIMPNAWSLFFSWYWRYNDITHKILYTENSFNQILLNHFEKDKVEHKNSEFLPWKNNLKNYVIKHALMPIILYIIRLLQFPIEKIWTFEMISKIKK